MPAIALSTEVTPPIAGDIYTYTTGEAGALFWKGGDVDVKLYCLSGANRKHLTTDTMATGFYDLPAATDVEFEVTPNKKDGEFWFKIEE